ncbi:MAG: DUF1846 domain-containing protein [Paludibacteraceae bacterium]|nr:DUF1846 domain-containing protein [Paludibacteraceae bacterium]
METKIGFDNNKYLSMQSSHIAERIEKFGNKLYLEIGGKLFDDYHASRVLPGFQPDSKLQMLLKLKEKIEIIIAINAEDIESNKIRADYGISYDEDVLRLIDAFNSVGLFVGSVCLTMFNKQPSAILFEKRLKDLEIPVYHHYCIDGYPNNVELIVSDKGYGKNEYIKTQRPLIVVTAPGPGSGKLAICLSQLYHEHKRGINAGYAKFETFPIWNIPLKHPINLAYEAATADLNDVNIIDSFHLEAYGETTVNYNRDVEAFSVLSATFEMIYGESPYKSPTDMGVNMAGNCIIDDEICKEASKLEIVRRYFKCLCDKKRYGESSDNKEKLESLMQQAHVKVTDYKVVEASRKKEEITNGRPAAAIELPDGTIVTGKTSDLLGPLAAALLNALKALANIDQSFNLVSRLAIEPIQTLKTEYLGSNNPRLHTDEILIALSSSAAHNELAERAMQQLPKLKGSTAHTTVLVSSIDEQTFKKLGITLTCEPKYEEAQRSYHKH